MLLELGLPSFNTLTHNCKVSLADRVAVCDNAIVRCVQSSDFSVNITITRKGMINYMFGFGICSIVSVCLSIRLHVYFINIINNM